MFWECEKFIIRSLEESDKEIVQKMEYENRYSHITWEKFGEVKDIIWGVYTENDSAYAIIQKDNSRLIGLIDVDMEDEEEIIRVQTWKETKETLKNMGLSQNIIGTICNFMDPNVDAAQMARLYRMRQDIKRNDKDIYTKDEVLNLIDEYARMDKAEVYDDIETIKQIVCNQFDITTDELVRNKEASNITAFLLRKYTDISLKSISEVIGCQKAADVIVWIRKVEEKMKNNATYLSRIDMLSREIEQAITK